MVILLSSGTSATVDLASEQVSWAGWAPGLGYVQALGEFAWPLGMRLDSSQKAADFFQKRISQEVEEFWIAALNPGLQIIESHLLFRGTVDSCPVHPRDIFRFACAQNASSFVVAHNHPSGDHRPSRQDVEITKRIFYLGQILEIQLNDHIILTKERYFSFADCGLIHKFATLKSLRLRP